MTRRLPVTPAPSPLEDYCQQWALEGARGPYGPEKAYRALVVPTEPATLPERATW